MKDMMFTGCTRTARAAVVVQPTAGSPSKRPAARAGARSHMQRPEKNGHERLGNRQCDAQREAASKQGQPTAKRGTTGVAGRHQN